MTILILANKMPHKIINLNRMYVHICIHYTDVYPRTKGHYIIKFQFRSRDLDLKTSMSFVYDFNGFLMALCYDVRLNNDISLTIM